MDSGRPTTPVKAGGVGAVGHHSGLDDDGDGSWGQHCDRWEARVRCAKRPSQLCRGPQRLMEPQLARVTPPTCKNAFSAWRWQQIQECGDELSVAKQKDFIPRSEAYLVAEERDACSDWHSVLTSPGKSKPATGEKKGGVTGQTEGNWAKLVDRWWRVLEREDGSIYHPRMEMQFRRWPSCLLKGCAGMHVAVVMFVVTCQ